MKKKDILTPVGLLVGTGFIVFGILYGSSLEIAKGFINIPSLAITVGGSLAATLITFPRDRIKNFGKVVGATFKDIEFSALDLMKQFTNLSRKARREGLLSLEDEVTNFGDDFLKKGMQMVVDGIEPDIIRGILEQEINELESRHEKNSSMIKTWGGYAPAFGMVGTLIGLIQMLADLSNMDGLAAGMSAALVTTFYGAVLANLLLNPLAANLEYKTSVEVTIREMMLEGILAIQSGVNPRIVEEKLISYLSAEERVEYVKIVANEAEVTENV